MINRTESEFSETVLPSIVIRCIGQLITKRNLKISRLSTRFGISCNVLFLLNFTFIDRALSVYRPRGKLCPFRMLSALISASVENIYCAPGDAWRSTRARSNSRIVQQFSLRRTIRGELADEIEYAAREENLHRVLLLFTVFRIVRRVINSVASRRRRE